MKSISKKAYAKINLFLDVHSKYENGYHEVSTVMQTVSLSDTVRVSLSKEGISIHCDSAGVPTDSRNLAYRAAELFLRESRIESGVTIEIEKMIPCEAGLGGGSADAAATLIALNELFDDSISFEKLLAMGGTLGADVPFCMVKGCAYAEGIGDVLYPLPSMPDCYIVIARGGEGFSTPIAYRLLDEKYRDFSVQRDHQKDAAQIQAAIKKNDIQMIANNTYNIFEEVILPSRKVASELIKTLDDAGALASMMSGSGTAVFGIFNDISKAEAVANDISLRGYFASVCEPVA